jgi:uncharacterized membrane protein
LFPGAGFGFIIQGVASRQLLQAHTTLSRRLLLNCLTSVKTNRFADGMSQLAMWTVALIGIAML